MFIGALLQVSSKSLQAEVMCVSVECHLPSFPALQKVNFVGQSRTLQSHVRALNGGLIDAEVA